MWLAARSNRALRITTGLMLMLAGMGVSAAAFGKLLHWYALLSLVALVASTVLTGILAGQVNAGGTAAWFGVAERALQGVWLQWVAVLAVVLLRARRIVVAGRTETPILTPQVAPGMCRARQWPGLPRYFSG